MAASNKLIAAVHAAAKGKGLDDDTYRDMLQAQTGKRSAKGCSDAQLRKVLDHLNGAGRPSAAPLAKSGIATKARALWLSLHNLGLISDPSESALRAWVKRQYHVEDLRFLKPSESFAVIEGLKQWATRAPAGVDWTAYQGVIADTAIAARRCVLAAQWRMLKTAGATPAADLASHLYTIARIPSLAFATDKQLDQLINDLGARVRAVVHHEGTKDTKE